MKSRWKMDGTFGYFPWKGYFRNVKSIAMIDKYKGTYRIPSARFAPHNYNEGTFFVTICTHERKHYFGNIIDEKMCLSKLGVYTEYCISQIPIINKHVILHSYVVMPNHIHLVICIQFPFAGETMWMFPNVSFCWGDATMWRLYANETYRGVLWKFVLYNFSNENCCYQVCEQATYPFSMANTLPRPYHSWHWSVWDNNELCTY